MSISQHNEPSSALYDRYISARSRELQFRKYPDTILVERIRQRHSIIADTENIRRQVDDMFVANDTRGIEKTLVQYDAKLDEFDKIFAAEQKELDAIKMVIREVPILITMLESAIKHLPKVPGDVTDSDKKIYTVTLKELKNYLKDMKLLQHERYKIDLTLNEAAAIGNKTKSIKVKLDKLMVAFEKKAVKFYDALSLMYKKARAKSRAQRKPANAKSKAKKKPTLKASVQKKNKEKTNKTLTEMRVGVSDYVGFFKDAFKKFERHYLKIKADSHSYLPRSSNASGKTAVTKVTQIHARVALNYDAQSLLPKLKNLQSSLEDIKQKGNAIAARNTAEVEEELQTSVDVNRQVGSGGMLDESKYGTHLRTAMLNAVSDFLNKQGADKTALYATYTPLAQIPALMDINDITGIINATLKNPRKKYADDFIHILKNNLAHVFRDTPFRFVDAQKNTNAMVFDPHKAQSIVDVNSVVNALQERSKLLDKGTAMLHEYNQLLKKYKKFYDAEAKNQIDISYRVGEVSRTLEKLKVKAADYLFDNTINALLAKIKQDLHYMNNPMRTTKEVQLAAWQSQDALKKLSAAIDRTAKENPSIEKTAVKNVVGKPVIDEKAALEKAQGELYVLIDGLLSSNPELVKSAEPLHTAMQKQQLKSRYSSTVGEVSFSANLLAIGEIARTAITPVSPRSPKSSPVGTLFNKSHAMNKRGHDFMALIGQLDKSVIKDQASMAKLTDAVMKFQKGAIKNLSFKK